MNDQQSMNGESNTVLAPVIPPEMLAKIFALLDFQSRGRAAQVCRTWRDGIYQAEVWRDTQVTVDIESPTNPTAFRSFRRFSVLKKTSQLCLQQDMSYFTKLRVVITESGMLSMIQLFRNFVSLNLSFSYDLTDDSLRLVAAGLPRLQHLDLSDCHEITDAGIAHLSGLTDVVPEDVLPKLKYLRLVECNELTDDSLWFLDYGQPYLQKLDLEVNRSFTESGFTCLGGMCHLHTLNLLFCYRVTDECLEELAMADSNIAVLSILDNICLTDDCFAHLARLQNLVSLRLTDVHGISSSGLRHFTGGPAGITELELYNCKKLNSEDLNSVLWNVRSGLPCLQTLKLGYSFGTTQQLKTAVAGIMPHLNIFGTS